MDSIEQPYKEIIKAAIEDCGGHEYFLRAYHSYLGDVFDSETNEPALRFWNKLRFRLESEVIEMFEY